MLRPRIIPCLLVKEKGLVKTVRFKNPKYVGDPLNAVRIFNEKEVDELMVLDIDASTGRKDPDFTMIRNLAVECRMPLCYGGGIKSPEQAKQIIGLGVEKVAISSALVANPGIIADIANEIGSQSVVAVMDVKKRLFGDKYEVWTHNGKNNSGKCPMELATQFERLGIGEIVINSIDNDGVMKGYDLSLAARIRDAVRVPMTVLGGSGSLQDLGKLISRIGVVGAAAGSMFVFKGVYKAVLINYPSPDEKDELIRVSYKQLYLEK